MAVVKNLMVRAGADFSSMRKEMTKAQSTIQNFKKNVTTAMKGVAAVLAAVGVSKVLSDARKLYEYQIEQETKLAVVMRQRMGATEQMIQSIKQLTTEQQKLGVIGDEVQLAGAQQLATFLKTDDALKSLIPAMNNLAAQQKGVNATGADLVNIGNMFGKVMEGQVGALRRVGISFSEAEEQVLKYGNEQERAATLAKVISNNVGEMNQALANTPQGRAAQLANAFGDFKEQIGKSVSILRDLFIPMLMRVVSVATTVAIRLQQVGHFFNALFGRSSTSETQSQTNAIGGQVKAVDDLGKSYNKAGKEAKKAQGSLAGFDEINSLAKANSGGSGGGSEDLGGIGSGAVSGVMPLNFETNASEIGEKVQSMALSIRQKFSDLKSSLSEHKTVILSVLGGIGVGLATYVIAIHGATIATKTWGAIAAVSTAITKGLGAAFAFLLSPIGILVATVAALTAGFIYFYRTNEKFRGVVDGILNKIKDVALSLWKNALVPLGNYVKGAFSGDWTFLTKVLDFLLKSVLTPLGNFVKSLHRNILVPLGRMLLDLLVVAFRSVADVAKSLWKNVLVPLGGFLSTVLSIAVQELSNWFKHFWQVVLVPFGNYLKGDFAQSWSVISNAISNLWKNILLPFIKWLSSEFFNGFNTVFKGIGELIKGFEQILVGLIKFLGGAFTNDWKKSWEGVREIFRGVFNSLYTIVKTPLNLIIDAINSVISGLNRIKFDIPDWVPGVGGKGFGINISKIPKLARGGVVNGATNFGNYIAGEAGAEMIVPLENTSFVDKLASALGTAVMNAMNVSSGGDLVLKVNEIELGRATAKGINKAQRVSGQLLLDL